MMAVMMKSLLFLTTLFICIQTGLGWDLQIKFSPDQINTDTGGAVNISCVTGPSINEVMVLKITKNHGKPMALFNRGSSIPKSASDDTVIDAYIGDIPGHSFMRLTLLDPKEEDAGLYQCVMYYVNPFGDMAEQRAEDMLALAVVDNIETDVESLLEKVSKLDGDLKTRRDYFTAKEAELKSQVSVLEGELQRESYTTAFSAKFNKTYSTNFQDGDTVIFDYVIMQVGEGYDSHTGLFTAPVSGIYGFHVSAKLLVNGFLELDLVVNDKTVAVLGDASTDNEPQAAISIVTELQANDVVKVLLKHIERYPNRIQGGDTTLFTGYLIHQTNN